MKVVIHVQSRLDKQEDIFQIITDVNEAVLKIADQEGIPVSLTGKAMIASTLTIISSLLKNSTKDIIFKEMEDVYDGIFGPKTTEGPTSDGPHPEGV